MKLPYSWLKEITGVDWSPEEMEDRLTRSGTAGVLESYNPEHFESVVTGRIIKLEKHPNADKLVVAEVDTGESVYSVICGAPNCEVGQVVPLAKSGANLKGKFQVKEITMRGVKSEGMICAEDELGLSDDHSGIMVFDNDTPLNIPVYNHLGLDNPVIDFEITPNRPDCLCVNGVAREISALADIDINLDKEPLRETSEKADDYIKVVIDDPEACPRYAARIIKGIKIGPSPEWMRKKLIDCGLRPINNIVDITNYVMLETNQPLHAFDYDQFGSKEVVVRRARDKERFTTLDEREHELNPDVLLITNGKEGVAAAGVMGGLDSEVSDDTTNILLESAYFDPSVIRRSRNLLGINSESSYRFERGIDPNGVVKAADRAAALMAEYAGGEVLGGVIDNYAKIINPVTISLRPKRASKIIGVEISSEFIEKILRRLGMEVKTGNTIEVTAPTYRPDITREIDLIEEIARIYGLDNIPSNTQNAGPLFSPTHRRDTIKNELRDMMIGFGFEESLGTGFAHPKKMMLLEPAFEPIKITNPISDEFGYMRTRLLYSLLVSAGHNFRRRNIDAKLFEIGKVYLKTESMPDEPEYFGFIMTGRLENVFWKDQVREADIFEIKGILGSLSDILRLGEISLKPESIGGFDKSNSYRLFQGNQQLGMMGMVDSKIAKAFDIKQDCYAVELELSELIASHKGVTPFSPLPKFPASARDIAIIVDEKTKSSDIQKAISDSGGKFLESITCFDLYKGKHVPEGKKSIAYSVNFRALDKTLEDADIDKAIDEIVKRLDGDFNAQLRE